MDEKIMMQVPEHLDQLTNSMDHSVRQVMTAMVSTLRANGIFTNLYGENSLPLALERLQKALEQSGNISFKVATGSDQSGGKSTLTDTILSFPLLPTAFTATTTCATEIHYSSEPTLEIRYYAGPKGNIFEEGGPRFSGCHLLGDRIWRGLLEYALLCIREKQILPETLQYHSDKNLADIELMENGGITWKDLQMSVADPRHVVQLLLLLFTTYVGQNAPNPTESIARVCGERVKLLRALGVDPDRDYAVIVGWNHPALEQGLVLVDLPGLSANVPDKTDRNGNVRRSHERISIDYFQEVDAVFLLFDPIALAGGASKIMKTILESEKMKHIVSKDNRIIPILNKVDTFGGQIDQKIPFSTNQIRQILAELDPPYVFPMSTLFGEYRFVESGLVPIRRTQAYLRNRDKIREDLLDDGEEPTQEKIEKKVLKRLKRDYEKSYQFTDINGKPCSINLEQWIRMMTTDYLNRAHALKAVELLRNGMEASGGVVDTIHSQISVLLMMKAGGEDLTKDLIDSLVKSMKSSLQSFGNKFSQIHNTLQKEFAALSRNDIPAIVVSYKKGLEQVEVDLASKIRNAVKQMEPNVFGNIILDPNQTFTSDGARRARKNKRIFDDLIKDLGAFDAASRLKVGEQQLETTIVKVQKAYDQALPELYQLYDNLIMDVSEAMDKAYEQSKNGAEDPARFDSIYGQLYRQLSDSILKELQKSVVTIKDTLQKDKRIAFQQKSTIDAAASFSVDLQDKYRNSSEAYIKHYQSETFIGTPSFDRNTLLMTLQTPFFTETTRDRFAQQLSEIFTQNYSKNINTIMSQIRIELDSMNAAGIDGRIQGLKTFIAQKIKQGVQTLDNEIDSLQFNARYIHQQMDELMGRILQPWETLHACAWAAEELDAIQIIYQKLSDEVHDMEDLVRCK